MAVFNGTNLVLVVDGSTVAHSRSCSVTTDMDLPDATTKDSSGWADHIQGVRSMSISVDGLIDYTSSAGVDSLRTLITSRSTATAIFATSTSGDTKITATVSLSSLTEDAPMEDVATWSGTLQVKGTPTVGTVA